MNNVLSDRRRGERLKDDLKYVMMENIVYCGQDLYIYIQRVLRRRIDDMPHLFDCSISYQSQSAFVVYSFIVHDLWLPVETRTSRCLFEVDFNKIDDRPITVGGAIYHIEQIKRFYTRILIAGCGYERERKRKIGNKYIVNESNSISYSPLLQLTGLETSSLSHSSMLCCVCDTSCCASSLMCAVCLSPFPNVWHRFDSLLDGTL